MSHVVHSIKSLEELSFVDLNSNVPVLVIMFVSYSNAKISVLQETITLVMGTS